MGAACDRLERKPGEAVATSDIRRPVLIEMTYDVLEAGHVLTPAAKLFNDEGTEVFGTHDTGDEWRRRARAAGRYTSAVRIPGNLLAEGSFVAHVSIMSHFPSTILHARAKDAAAFQIVDESEGASARGDYAGLMRGVVRPLLEWTTRAGTAEG